MSKETLFDGIEITKTECHDGLENGLNSILNGWCVSPKMESSMNQMLTFLIRTIERATEVH